MLAIIHIDMIWFIWVIDDSIFPSILYLLLLNNFLKNEIKFLFLSVFFFRFQRNSTTYNILNTKFMVQKI